MRIHKLSNKEIGSLNIPIQKYEEDINFREFKDKASSLLGENSLKYIKYFLAIYVMIDLYRLSKNEEKNGLVKMMEKFGLCSNTIKKIDNGLKYGLSASYLSLLLLKK